MKNNSLRDFERYLRVCNGKCILINCESGICFFQIGVEKSEVNIGNDSYRLSDINNEFNSINIIKENITYFEFCKSGNQLIIKLSNNSEITIEIV